MYVCTCAYVCMYVLIGKRGMYVSVYVCVCMY
jgi:hypothetical protein